MFDSKCLQLAEQFLADEPADAPMRAKSRILAQVIQDAIEDWTEDQRQDAEPHLPLGDEKSGV